MIEVLPILVAMLNKGYVRRLLESVTALVTREVYIVIWVFANWGRGHRRRCCCYPVTRTGDRNRLLRHNFTSDKIRIRDRRDGGGCLVGNDKPCSSSAYAAMTMPKGGRTSGRGDTCWIVFTCQRISPKSLCG